MGARGCPSPVARGADSARGKEGGVNRRRVAALLRELAEAFEAEDEPKRRKPHIAPVKTQPSSETIDGVRRGLRKKGVVQ